MLAKKYAVIVLLAVLVLSSFAAAPTNAQNSNPTIPAAKCASPGKLTMWVWDGNWQKVIVNSIETWKKDYCPGADVDVQIHPWGQYWDLLKTSAASGSLPDVFNITQDRFQEYAKANAMLDLQPYWDKAGIKTDIWPAGEVGPYRSGNNNDLYAGPVNWDTVTLFYNKDLFDAAKLKYPTADWTWDDFAKDAAALTDTSKDQYGAAVYTEYQAGYANWIASTGVSPLVDPQHTKCTLNDPGSLEALNFLKGLFDKGYMPKVSIMGGSSADDEFNFFQNSKVAMIGAGSWKLPDAMTKLKFNWDIVQLPKYPKTGESRAILHSVGYAASAKTQNPDLAANLIVFLVSDVGQKFFADAGGVAPANPNPDLQKEWKDSFKTDKNIQAFVDATKNAQGVTLFTEIEDATNTGIVVNLFDVGMSVNDAIKAACDVINKYVSAK